MLAPYDFELVFSFANAHYLNGDREKARNIYLQIVTQNPTDYRSWYNLGETYFKEEQYQKAYDCFTKAEPLTPYVPTLPARIAECQQKLKNAH